MTFYEFKRRLMAEGASLRQIQNLDKLALECAMDAHSSAFDAGELAEYGIISNNDFRSFCAHIRREFVIDNWGILFCPEGYIN